MSTRRDNFSPVAESTPFDNSINGFAADDVQEAIEEIDSKVTGKPRAIITYSYNGNASNRWLELAHSIPSDGSPYVAPEDSRIKALSVAVRASTTATATVYINAVAVTTLTITAGTSATVSGLSYNVFVDDEVSVKVTSGSMNEPIFTVSLEVNL